MNMKFKQWCDRCKCRVEIETNNIAVVNCPNCGRPLMPCPICNGSMDSRELWCRRGCDLKCDYIKKIRIFEKADNL